jgi:hypothetical protein
VPISVVPCARASGNAELSTFWPRGRLNRTGPQVPAGQWVGQGGLSGLRLYQIERAARSYAEHSPPDHNEIGDI